MATLLKWIWDNMKSERQYEAADLRFGGLKLFLADVVMEIHFFP